MPQDSVAIKNRSENRGRMNKREVHFKGFWIKSVRELLLYCVISQLETAYGCLAAITPSQL